MSTETQPRRRNSMDKPPSMFMRSLVLVGKTGAGKSSSGNTILGRNGFRAAKSGSSITKECWKEEDCVADRQVVVVDTPGIFDNTLSEKDLIREIGRCINMTAPGPHAIVLVIQPGPFTEEECMAVQRIRAIFGKEADRYTMILFTHGDQLSGGIEELLTGAGRNLKDLMYSFGGRYHVFDNTRMDDRTQVLEFMDKVENMVTVNGGENYTNPMFEVVEQKLKDKEEQLKKKYELRLLELETELNSKFNEEKRKLQEVIETLKESQHEREKKVKEMQELVRKKDRELKEYKRFFKGKRLNVRLEAEQTDVNENISVEVSANLKKLRI